ncbi:hypothetical protein LTR10_021228 [Elasticomyces elasticus]|uniref:Xylanolytic transcriptional activator regulatory domain-containing protein n=1 Tax=Exophiala sideris TaxID=1016849 RepID=A0ABR0IY34_9EURO|nr:hypothetical protein LTR10_021228 [Elasticomyces elasticus]KAK5022355.1 hypothetical protein LTS07_010231 [Exophiala sideris]KAK5027167.1 hypothetical protein LTR13_009777 [Exophiala sideris]KAK5051742.1 hypothetical protein LTR69_010242 [Exophiala sideris]KAK5177707.1 hypothetical protein LTR44_009897 [Eurotiomycetes sp. CCFEE 6388]
MPGKTDDICQRKGLRFVDVTSKLHEANEHSFGHELLVALQIQAESLSKWPALAALSHEQCRKLCEHYRRLANAVPFAIHPPSTDPQHLLSTSPLLLLSIILSASSSCPELERQCEDTFRHVLADRAIIRGQRSLELLQSLLTYLIWYPHRFDPSNQQFYQFLQLALGMAADLGLYKQFSHAKSTEATDGLSTVRTFLLCYYLGCGCGILGFDRPDVMRCVEKVRVAAGLLAEGSDNPLDKEAPAIVELMHIAAQQWDCLSSTDTARLASLDSSTNLEMWRVTHFRPTLSAVLKSSYYFISAYGIIKSTKSRSLPAQTIRTCVEHLVALLSNVLDQDISYLFLLGAVEWGHVLTSLFLLPKLETSLPVDSAEQRKAPFTFQYVGGFRNLLHKIRIETDTNSTLNTPHFFDWIEKILAAVEKQTLSRLHSSTTDAGGLNSEETAHELVNSFVDDEKHGGSRTENDLRQLQETTTEDFWTDFMSDWLHW